MSDTKAKLDQLRTYRTGLAGLNATIDRSRSDFDSVLKQQEAAFNSQIQELASKQQTKLRDLGSLEDSVLKDLTEALNKLKRSPMLTKDQKDETISCFEEAIRKRNIAFAYNLLNALKDGVYLGDFIDLPETVHRNTKYLSSYIEKYRLGYSPRVGIVNRLLGLSLENTAEEQTSGRPYIGKMTWETALKLNLALNGKTPSPRRFHDSRLLLKDGIEGTIVVYDGLGREVDKEELTKIRDEKEAKKDPYRCEFLDARFVVKEKGKLHILSSHVFSGTELVPSYDLELQSCVMEDCYVDAFSFNEQGLPTKGSDIQEYRLGETVFYGYPRNGSVERFVANSGGAVFYCDCIREASWPSLGVRHEREKFVL